MTFLSQVPQLVSFRPTRSIGGFVATVTIDEKGTDELEITQHPVQQGAQISDHAYLKPATLSVQAKWGVETGPLDETYKALLALQAAREPIDVVTGKRIYKNMLIQSLGQTNDSENENILSVDFSLQEIIIVNVEVTTVPAREKHANSQKTSGTQKSGTKQTKTLAKPNSGDTGTGASQSKKKTSALNDLFGK